MYVDTLTLGILRTNCYLISNDGACVIIDPGAEASRIDAHLKTHGLHPQAILLTHGHFDHTGAMWPLYERYQLPIYISSLDLDPLVNPTPRRLLPPPGTQFISDGQEIIAAGLRFQVIACPGHTPGSVSYLCEDMLFTGDTLFHQNCGRCDHTYSSAKDLLASLDRLRRLPGDYRLFPGHLKSSTLDWERQNNPFLQPGIQLTEPEEDEDEWDSIIKI